VRREAAAEALNPFYVTFEQSNPPIARKLERPLLAIGATATGAKI